MSVPAWAWWAFAVSLAVLLVLDLGSHRGHHQASQRAAVLWTVLWIAVGLGFNLFVWFVMGERAAVEYLAAYLMEKSLSLDNLFVFLVIFHSLRIPPEHQRRVLTWGIFGALFFRAIFIFIGARALERYGWVSWVFGAILLWAAYRAFREHPEKESDNRLVRFLSKKLPVSEDSHDGRFFARKDGRRVVTSMFVAVIAVELTDIMFAVDSVPAAFSVTRNTFLVYTSNAFAILGLRSLYLVLARVLEDLRYLHYGLAAVLAFAGVKMLTEEWVHIPPLISVAIIAACIGMAALASLTSARPSASPSHS